MADFTQQTNGMWAPEGRSRSSGGSSSSSDSSTSSVIQLPSVKALAFRFNSLGHTGGVVIRGTSKPSSMPVPTQVKAAPVAQAIKVTQQLPGKVVENKAQKSSAVDIKTETSETKPVDAPVMNGKLRDSITTDSDDEVFETETNIITAKAPAHFAKKPTASIPKEKSGFSTFPSRTPAKKWSSLSDLHKENAKNSSSEQRNDSVSFTTIFGVSLRRLDSISWGVTQTRKSSADDSDSSSDDESQFHSPNVDKEDSGMKYNTFPKNLPVHTVVEKKHSAGGVKSKINQKMGNKDEVKYHSQSDLTAEGVEAVSATWRCKSPDAYSSPHQTLTRRHSISELLRLYRTKSQSDLSKIGDANPPPSPKFEPFARPKTPVSSPLTMYDLKINNPMEKPKISPYKGTTNVRLPPGLTSIAPKKPALVLAPVPSKVSPKINSNSNNEIPRPSLVPGNEPISRKIESSPPKSTLIQATHSSAAPLLSSKTAPAPAKETPVISNSSSTVSKATLDKTLSRSSSSNSDSEPEPKSVHPVTLQKPRVYYQPPPQHFNRPFINQTPRVIHPKEAVSLKVEQNPKFSGVPTSDRIHASQELKMSSPPKSSAKTQKLLSTSSSEDEPILKPKQQEKYESKPPDKALNPVSTLIKSLNRQKDKPIYPAKPDILRPKPQDSIWVAKNTSMLQSSSPSPPKQDINAETRVSSQLISHRNNEIKKVTRDSSVSSDEIDGVPHEEKGASFIVAKHKKHTSITGTHTPPNSPIFHSGTPRIIDKLSVKDSLDSWAKEVKAKDSPSSDDSSEDERTGSYSFKNANPAGSKLLTPIPYNGNNKSTTPNVTLIKHKPIVERYSADPPLNSREEPSQAAIAHTVKIQLKGESLPAVAYVRKTPTATERKLSSSSDDGHRGKSTPTTPFRNSSRPQPINQQNNAIRDIKRLPESASTEKKVLKHSTSAQNSVDKKSVSKENSSSGENSAKEPFKEIDPYAIGRMIVRGSRKSDSFVKKPENLTNIRNASVPAHSPFSPLKSSKRNMSGPVTKPKSQEENSSGDDEKSIQKTAAQKMDSSNYEQDNPKVIKMKRSILRRVASASSDADSSDGGRGLELRIDHDSDHSDGVYSANVAYLD